MMKKIGVFLCLTV